MNSPLSHIGKPLKLPLRLEVRLNTRSGTRYCVLDAEQDEVMSNLGHFPTAPSLEAAKMMVDAVNRVDRMSALLRRMAYGGEIPTRLKSEIVATLS